MLRYVLALALLAMVAAQDEEQVCYPYLGCFSMRAPWSTLLRPLPAPGKPEDIDTKIYFYTRRNSSDRFYVPTRPEMSVEGSDFQASRPTYVLTHGFASNGNSTWLSGMKDALLNKIDANVFLIDWGKGASTLNYFQVASNTRVVGREVERLLQVLIKERGLQPSSLHLIGHSLGAHICSYASKNINGIHRLTALDPAQPGFEGFGRQVRLDASDATYVDVIHSDAKPLIPFLGFGYITSVGDNDYYLNGGFSQPGCILPKKIPNITSFLDLAKVPVEVIFNFISCPHSRSHEVFTDSIRYSNCTFWGHPASIIDDVAGVLSRGYLQRYLTPSNRDCTVKSCSPLGLDSIDYPARGVYNVPTLSNEPYCIPEPEVDEEMAENLERYEKNLGSNKRRPGILPFLPRVPGIPGIGK